MPSLKRCILIALMLVLLPLRGWAGNVMAVDMAAQQVMMAQSQTTDVVQMPADCAMTMQEPAQAVKQAGTGSSHCYSCDTCELCLALATASQTNWPASNASKHNAALQTGIAFRSAESASSFKPPIS
jgi:hypothetical protein